MKSDDPRSLSFSFSLSLFPSVSLAGIDGDVDVATLLSQLLTADRAVSRCFAIANFANSNCTSVRIVSSSNRRALNLN